MALHGFALVRVAPSTTSLFAEMRPLAVDFFRRPREERCGLGRLRLYKDKVVGYRELGGGAARFLEVHALAEMGSIPRPKVLGFSPAAVKLHAELQGMARDMLAWLAEGAALPPEALLQCLDEASLGNLEAGDCGASVLRLACYGLGAEGGAGGEALSDAQGDHVTFDEHTDASYLTLAPVCEVPGLQMRSPTQGDAWVDVEGSHYGQGEHMIVFIGDFVEVLTKGKYVAARHRVCLPPQASAGTPRLSMPFLVRGQPDALIDTGRFVAAGAEVLQVDGMEVREMRRFLDLKGRARFGKEGDKRLLSASPYTADAG